MSDNHNTLTVENFLPEPEAFRNEVKRLPFYDIDFLGECYKRIHVRSTDEHKGLLQRAVGRSLKQGHTLIRMNFEKELPNNAIHSDDSCGGYVGICYLNLPSQCQGGTAFWRHKKLGYEKMPMPHELKAKGIKPMRVYEQLCADFNNADAWEQTHLNEMAFNRLVVFPAVVFHSRFPFEAFGQNPDNGRLSWTSFFECKS